MVSRGEKKDEAKSLADQREELKLTRGERPGTGGRRNTEAGALGTTGSAD